MGLYIPGVIRGYDGQVLQIEAPCSDAALLQRWGTSECGVLLEDGRTISPKQRRYIYAMLRDIAAYTGHTAEELKDHFKAQWVAETGGEWFSLSGCSVDTANRFIELLITFCIQWCVPTQDNLAEFAPDVGRYVYWCLMHKVCCISRQKGAELHHVDAVGRGRNRKDILHLGMRALPLLRTYHAEAHNMGRKSFQEKYHVYGIPLDQELCKVWRVKGG